MGLLTGYDEKPEVFDDLDDAEMSSYLLSEKESNFKKKIWIKLNADWVEEQEEKLKKEVGWKGCWMIGMMLSSSLLSLFHILVLVWFCLRAHAENTEIDTHARALAEGGGRERQEEGATEEEEADRLVG